MENLLLVFLKRLHIFHGHDFSLFDDGCTGTGPFHFLEHMGGHQYGLATLFFFPDQINKLVLHQRGQPAGRLIQNIQVGGIHKSTDNTDLLLHSFGHFFNFSPRIQREHFYKFLHYPLHVRHESQELFSCHIVHKCDLSRQIPKRSMDCFGLLKTVLSADGTDPFIRGRKAQKVPYCSCLSSTVRT